MRTLVIATATLAGIASLGIVDAAVERVSTSDVAYEADLQPLNAKASGMEAHGTARFVVRGDQLTIRVSVRGVPPNVEHWQHFHGFVDGRQATCAPPAADANHDGYIDILETEPYMGVTMVPFNADPPALRIPTDTYPHADASGAFEYQKTVSLRILQQAFGQKYGGTIDLDKRVVQVHGVVEPPVLPGSVASLTPIPSRVTIPLACGVIRRVVTGREP